MSLPYLSAEADEGGGAGGSMMKIIIVMGPIPTKRGRGIERRRNRLQVRGNKT